VKSTPPTKQKIAIVHEWLDKYAGGERVLEQILEIYPDADLFAVVNFLPSGERWFIKNKPVTTTFIQKIPFARKVFRKLLPLMPLAIEQLDLSGYDLIISNSHAVAKGVITGPDQLHICHCFSPTRYAWDLQQQYLEQSGLVGGIKGKTIGMITRILLHRYRKWDYLAAQRPDYFIANSNFIARRIQKIYRRDSVVVHSPVDTEFFTPSSAPKQDFYVTSGRITPYKRLDIIVQAFVDMEGKTLRVIGEGSEMERIKAIAKKGRYPENVQFLGFASADDLLENLRSAKAFVFAALEDFGIAPLEAQACGTPVIAYGKGGALDTIIADGANPTGVFFGEQTADSLKKAVAEFESNADKFTPANCVNNAQRFSKSAFQQKFKEYISSTCKCRPSGGSAPL
jgi:glycosyltransferase involved in cell wall biosynthesis